MISNEIKKRYVYSSIVMAIVNALSILSVLGAMLSTMALCFKYSLSYAFILAVSVLTRIAIARLTRTEKYDGFTHCTIDEFSKLILEEKIEAPLVCKFLEENKPKEIISLNCFKGSISDYAEHIKYINLNKKTQNKLELYKVVTLIELNEALKMSDLGIE